VKVKFTLEQAMSVPRGE